jgi:hypothetical protein
MAHELTENHQLAKAFSVSPSVGGTWRDDAHLAVYWYRGIDTTKVEDYEYEGVQACQGVNLLGEMINTRPRASVQRNQRKGRDRPILSTGIGDGLE